MLQYNALMLQYNALMLQTHCINALKREKHIKNHPKPLFNGKYLFPTAFERQISTHSTWIQKTRLILQE